MKKMIKFQTATRISFYIFGLVSIFHFSIIIGILVFNYVPLDFVWGGQMQTAEELLGFEIISLVTIFLCMLIVSVRVGIVHAPRLMSASKVSLWVLSFLFLLNTVGNLFAKSNFERVFALLTAMLFVLCLRMAIEPIKKKGV